MHLQRSRGGTCGERYQRLECLKCYSIYKSGADEYSGRSPHPPTPLSRCKIYAWITLNTMQMMLLKSLVEGTDLCGRWCVYVTTPDRRGSSVAHAERLALKCGLWRLLSVQQHTELELDLIKGTFRSKFNPWSNTLWHWVRPPPSRSQVFCLPSYVALAASEKTAQ